MLRSVVRFNRVTRSALSFPMRDFPLPCPTKVLAAVGSATSSRHPLRIDHSLALRLSVARRWTSSLSTTSTQSESPEVATTKLYPVYVHHVSQTVLRHLQDNRSEWLMAHKLDQGLRLNRNGTFLLHFPCRSKGLDAGRIWYVTKTSIRKLG